MAEDRISELNKSSIKFTQSDQHINNRLKKKEQNSQDNMDNKKKNLSFVSSESQKEKIMWG